MSNETIVTDSPVGRHLDSLGESKPASYLMFNKKKVELVAKITIGRESDNDVIVDNKLASRHHALIQKIKNAYFIKDEESTNGTFVNGIRIPAGKYVKLNPGDKITIGNMNLVIS
ncbi:MAG: FHA domain-containing protein [Treponema sp.]|nr:FHA domain-containing protein [Treponema sp.]MCI6891968.1 FHA domain-containing protein [Treponema sp.]MCI7566482.1 FHA domain-containing protein [Treponema sp.]